jgi:hypothetical protein
VQEFTHRLELYLSTAQHEKLELARDLMMHSNPTGDLSAVVERALDLLIAQQHRRQYGVKKARPPKSNEGPSQTSSVRTESPVQPAKQAAKGRGKRPAIHRAPRDHVPNEVRRQIFERDGRQCTFISPSGKRCESRQFLQIHHDKPWARDGPDTLENLRLLCAAHNQLLAEQAFGKRKNHI